MYVHTHRTMEVLYSHTDADYLATAHAKNGTFKWKCWLGLCDWTGKAAFARPVVGDSAWSTEDSVQPAF